MSWFFKLHPAFYDENGFSSPSGDGWFNFTDVSLGDTVKFSSPLGDGLVHR